MPDSSTELPRELKISLMIPGMSQGGAERVMAHLANHWATSGHQVVLNTWATVETDSYPLDSRVKRIGLNLQGTSRGLLQSIRNNLYRVRTLRKIIREQQPDVIVSFLTEMNVTTVLAARRLQIPMIISEQIAPMHHKVGNFWSTLRTRTYPKANLLTVMTTSAREHFQQQFSTLKVASIPNSVYPEPSQQPSEKQKTILSVGRLVPQKAFDVLIPAFAEIADEFPEWNLLILGEGAERVTLESLIQQQGLQQRVSLPGWVADTARYYQSSQLFVMASRYEGFMIVLVEAMSFGLPVISTDCDCGPAEIIRPGIDGELVPVDDVPALAEGMRKLLADERLRQEYGKAATEVTTRFSPEAFFQNWDQAIQSVLN